MPKHIPLSILDLAPVSVGQSGAEAIRASLELARVADDAGYQRIWFAQHHLSPGVASAQPAVLAALAAERTSRIRVGSGAVLLGSTTPLVGAEQFGTIAAAHPGRVDLGVGRAFNPSTDGVPRERVPGDSEPATRVLDGLVVPKPSRFDLSNPVLKRRLLAHREVVGSREGGDFRAELEQILALRDGTYAFDGLAFTSPPVDAAAFDLWVLASTGGESARVAGELGLPLAANYHVAPGNVLDTVATYRAAFRPGVLAEPYVVVSADVLVAETGDRARELGEPFADWVRSIRSGVDGAIAFPAPGTTTPYAQWSDEDRELVADRVDTRFVGSPDEVVARLEALVRVTGADELLITTEVHAPADRERSFTLLAEAWNDRAPVLSAPEAGARVEAGALLIDVRSAGGRASAGEIPGARATDRVLLESLVDATGVALVPLDTPVIVVCGSVNGSGPVARELRRRGFTDVAHVDGGFPAWAEAGLPTVAPQVVSAE
ncbi:putative monooxygenase (luciferase-like) [Cellulomonas chitinilytica]|uniref:Monooxygenase (Luciferase-like) n=1 Tax=Cellulomonas chitinilytica TaxID=398759 RepID=A0A919P1U5_9CELL|nr:LLM class flavin-dependent oxidoreductase [Cellulomonas chitinilytica]GIG21738.1 putative monooxygenase (luciferase-like) [Cellulomonas chitinilytica]